MEKDGQILTLSARKEIVLSSGTLNDELVHIHSSLILFRLSSYTTTT